MARVFLIDDDEQLLTMVGMMIERGGHEPVLISDPVAGLRRIKEEKPDLLVLDVMMPRMNGHDVCRQIRSDKEISDLPILILTARAQEVDRATALKSGADDYLTKPIASKELLERIGDLLTRRPAAGERLQAIRVSLFGLRGGVGKTTLAVNLAAALRRISQEEVSLVDFSPSGAQAAAHLRIQATRSWADLPADYALKWETMQDCLYVHQSGLRLLSAPAVPQGPDEWPEESASRVLALLSDHTVATVIDLPAVMSPAARVALRASDVILHVITPDVVSVRSAVQANRMLVASGIDMKRVGHVLNQVQSQAPLPPNTVERGLGVAPLFHIQHDANQSRALIQGIPLALTSAQSTLPVIVGKIAEVVWQRISKPRSAQAQPS